MSGHSKWHNIQAHKGKQDAAKANVFTKCAKAITIAAQRGSDPATNFTLRLAIDKAKAVSMPKDNIDRAIKRGTGQDAGAAMEELLYEAFGPGGVAILIKAVTDNRNRTFPELKHIMSEHGGSMAGEGSVKWMFEYGGRILVSSEAVKNRDEFELAMIDAGASDIAEQEGVFEIRTKTEQFQTVVTWLKQQGIEPTSAELSWFPKEETPVPEEAKEELGALFAALEEHDDTADYYTNAA